MPSRFIYELTIISTDKATDNEILFHDDLNTLTACKQKIEEFGHTISISKLHQLIKSPGAKSRFAYIHILQKERGKQPKEQRKNTKRPKIEKQEREGESEGEEVEGGEEEGEGEEVEEEEQSEVIDETKFLAPPKIPKRQIVFNGKKVKPVVTKEMKLQQKKQAESCEHYPVQVVPPKRSVAPPPQPEGGDEDEGSYDEEETGSSYTEGSETETGSETEYEEDPEAEGQYSEEELPSPPPPPRGRGRSMIPPVPMNRSKPPLKIQQRERKLAY